MDSKTNAFCEARFLPTRTWLRTRRGMATPFRVAIAARKRVDNLHGSISLANVKTTIRFAEPSDAPAILRFNRRFRAAGRSEALHPDPKLPGEARYRPEGFPLCQRLMIAEDGQEIRAGMMLLHHTIFVRGKEQEFCWTDWPLSEGLIDRAHSLAIIQLLRRALSYQPFLLGLGVGSLDEDWARIVLAFGWRQGAVPFFFYPVRATRVLLGLRYLRTRRALRLGAVAAACCGLGVGLTGFLSLRRRLAAAFSSCEIMEEKSFGEWADRVFANCLRDYGATACRKATALNILYPPDDTRFIRLRVLRKDTKEDVGWILVLNTQMRVNQYFGDLKVGTVVDGFGAAEEVPALLRAAVDYLSARDADIIVGNFSHTAWVEASRRTGFFSGPSNYFLFASPGGPLLEDGCPLPEIHLTRGDCNGFTHLL